MAKRLFTKEIELIKSKIGQRSIVLVGLMGAGKTSVGRRLAERLQLRFVDADHEIESAAGQTIPEIFADHGEPYFREGEKRVIARLLESGPQILATGGGAYINADTRNEVRKYGISVWLKADLDLLLKRVAKRDNRPLLKQEDPAVVMRKLMDARYPIYAEADITVESSEAQHSQVVNEVIRSIANSKVLETEENAQT